MDANAWQIVLVLVGIVGTAVLALFGWVIKEFYDCLQRMGLALNGVSISINAASQELQGMKEDIAEIRGDLEKLWEHWIDLETRK